MSVFFRILLLAGLWGGLAGGAALAQKTPLKLVAVNDCGVTGAQPFLSLIHI